MGKLNISAKGALLATSVLGATLATLPATAEDQNNRGGFFDKDYVNQGFFDPPKRETEPADEPEAAEEAPAADSWSVKTPLQRGTHSEPEAEEPAGPVPESAPELSPKELRKIPPAMRGPVPGSQGGPAATSQTGLLPEREQAFPSIGEKPQITVPPANEPSSVTTLNPEPPRAVASDATLNLVVSAQPPGHLLQVLQRLRAFVREHPVRIGEIVVIGATRELDFFDHIRPESFGPEWKKEYRKKLSQEAEDPAIVDRAVQEAERLQTQTVRTLQDLRISEYSNVQADTLLKWLKVLTSPAYIIRYRGKDHIFEGNYALEDLFDREGFFTGETLDVVDDSDKGST